MLRVMLRLDCCVSPRAQDRLLDIVRLTVRRRPQSIDECAQRCNLLHGGGYARLMFFQHRLLHGFIVAAQCGDQDELMLMQALHGRADGTMQIGKPLLGATTGRLLHERVPQFTGLDCAFEGAGSMGWREGPLDGEGAIERSGKVIRWRRHGSAGWLQNDVWEPCTAHRL